MKKILFIITLIFALSCKAQTPIISITEYEENAENIDLVENCYLKDVDNKFTPFLGTWVWTNGNNILTVTLEKMEMVYSPPVEIYEDIVVGKYKYVENGVEIINTLNWNITPNNVWAISTIYPHMINTPMDGSYDTDSELFFSFNDYLKNKNEMAYFELLDLFEDLDGSITATQAKLTLQNREHITINGQNPRDPEFTIPTNIILTKQ